jgi:hypothetical protein
MRVDKDKSKFRSCVLGIMSKRYILNVQVECQQAVGFRVLELGEEKKFRMKNLEYTII